MKVNSDLENNKGHGAHSQSCLSRYTPATRTPAAAEANAPCEPHTKSGVVPVQNKCTLDRPATLNNMSPPLPKPEQQVVSKSVAGTALRSFKE